MLCALVALVALSPAPSRGAPQRYGFLSLEQFVTRQDPRPCSLLPTPRLSNYPGADSGFFNFQLFVSDLNETWSIYPVGTLDHDPTLGFAPITPSDAFYNIAKQRPASGILATYALECILKILPWIDAPESCDAPRASRALSIVLYDFPDAP